MTASDALTLRRLTGSKVRIGRYGCGAVFILAAYDAPGQTFTAVHYPSMAPAGTVSAAEVLTAKRERILFPLR